MTEKRKYTLLQDAVLFVFTTVFLLGFTESKGVDLGVCSNENVVCGCGSVGGLEIHVPIKRCTVIHRWKPKCEPCERYDKNALCSQFRHCLSCTAQKDGGCSACPVGKYGKHCQGVCQCQNGGICNPKDGSCRCPAGYIGASCEKSKQSICGPAPTIRHGTASGNIGATVQEGNIVSYRCDNGYTLVGPTQKRCEKTGTWSGGEPRCEYMCRVPTNRPFLTISVEPYVTMPTEDNPQGVELVRRLRFACQAGYVLQGLSELNCLSTNQWNGEVPSCVKSCGNPPTITNGKFEGINFVEGGEVNFYCNKGFIMTGDAYLTCQNGQWTGRIPTCIPDAPEMCNAPVFEGQAVPDSPSYSPGAEVTLICKMGFRLEGVSDLTCLDNGQWDAAVPKCVPEQNTCPALQAPENGSILPGNIAAPVIAGQKVQLKCSLGYIIEGSTERICLTDGTWSGMPTKCKKAVSCDDPGTPRNAVRARVEIPSNMGGNSGAGRNRLGRGRRRFVPVTRSNTNLPDGKFLINTRITFNCKSDAYTLVGLGVRFCQANGQWSGQQPTCVPVCGKSAGARSSKIIRGEVSKLGEYPWQAMLAHLRSGGEFYGVCGGTMINEDWIITAAHCVTEQGTTDVLSTTMIKIYMGKYFRDNGKDDNHVQEFTVSQIHIHPNYNPLDLDSDMALVKLSRSAVLSQRVMPICLPENSQSGRALAEQLISPKPKSFITVSGWGETENQVDSEILLTTRLGTISNVACEERYTNNSFPLVVTPNMFCAGHDDARSDTCFGDSGGPAIAYNGSGEQRLWYLVGIVSWGSPIDCAVAMHYSGFTRVIQFLDYINDITST